MEFNKKKQQFWDHQYSSGKSEVLKSPLENERLKNSPNISLYMPF